MKQMDTGSATSGQSTIQMYVATVDDHMLPGYVTGLCRHEKQNHSSNFIRFGHPLAQRDLSGDLLKFFVGIWKAAEPEVPPCPVIATLEAILTMQPPDFFKAGKA